VDATDEKIPSWREKQRKLRKLVNSGWRLRGGCSGNKHWQKRCVSQPQPNEFVQNPAVSREMKEQNLFKGMIYSCQLADTSQKQPETGDIDECKTHQGVHGIAICGGQIEDQA
jgi:hypothetical protein